ncbi:Uncharacterised protein [Vibrio cholerae]|nr:Uncharacterised protein [Vibrio cholerae]
MPPNVTVFMPSDIAASTLKNHHFTDVFDFWIAQCFIDVFL